MISSPAPLAPSSTRWSGTCASAGSASLEKRAVAMNAGRRSPLLPDFLLRITAGFYPYRVALERKPQGGGCHHCRQCLYRGELLDRSVQYRRLRSLLNLRIRIDDLSACLPADIAQELRQG